jgi:hypothetical protein
MGRRLTWLSGRPRWVAPSGVRARFGVRAALAFVVVGLLTLTPHVHAQSSSRAQLEMARNHMELGQDLYGRGRYLEAAEEFMAAYQAREFSAFLFNAAMCYERFGDPARAADLYQRYLDREPSASDRGEVTLKIAALRAQAAAHATEAVDPNATPVVDPPVTPNPDASTTTPTPPVTPPVAPPVAPPAPVEEMKSLLSVQTQPEGAIISVKRGTTVVATGPSPFAHTLDEGEYELFVEHPDYRTVQQHIRVRQGKVYVVIIEMSQAQFLGYLQVISNPPGSRVYLDDREAGSHAAPYANEIPIGTHRVWIERPGYETVEREVEVGLGEQVDVRVDLTRVDHGRVRMVGNVRPAEVFVDDTRVGAIPYEGDVPSGRHRIRVSANSMKDWEEEVEIEPGQVTPMRVRLRPSQDRGGAYATLALAVASAGAGVGLTLVSRDLRDDVQADLDAGLLTSDDPRIQQGRVLTIGADVAYGASGLIGLLSIYYFVHDPLPDSEGTILEPRDWTYVPTYDVRTGTAALTVSGRF